MVIWLITTSADSNLQKILQGNFPVRVFSSVEAAKFALKVNGFSNPATICFESESTDSDSTTNAINLLKAWLNAQSPRAIPITAIEQTNLQPSSIQISNHGPQRPKTTIKSEFDLVRYLNSSELFDIQTTQDNQQSEMLVADIALDLRNLTLTHVISQVSFELTKREVVLLHTLMSHPDKCLSRAEIANEAWGGTRVSPRTIDCQVSRLRKLLKGTEVSIHSSYGNGYTLSTQPTTI